MEPTVPHDDELTRQILEKRFSPPEENADTEDEWEVSQEDMAEFEERVELRQLAAGRPDVLEEVRNLGMELTHRFRSMTPRG